MSTATAEDTTVDLSFLLDEPIICECCDVNSWDKDCPEIAVANVLVRHCYTACCNFPIEYWVLMCVTHIVRGRDGDLQCQCCESAGAYVVMKEVPL